MKQYVVSLIVILSMGSHAFGQLIKFESSNPITRIFLSPGYSYDSSVSEGSKLSVTAKINPSTLKTFSSSEYDRLYTGISYEIHSGNYSFVTKNGFLSFRVFDYNDDAWINMGVTEGISTHSPDTFDPANVTGSIFYGTDEIPLNTESFFPRITIGTGLYMRDVALSLSELEYKALNDPEFVSLNAKSIRSDFNFWTHGSIGIDSNVLISENSNFRYAGYAVPEPSVYGLTGVLFLGSIILFRRMRNRKTDLSSVTTTDT